MALTIKTQTPDSTYFHGAVLQDGKSTPNLDLSTRKKSFSTILSNRQSWRWPYKMVGVGDCEEKTIFFSSLADAQLAYQHIFGTKHSTGVKHMFKSVSDDVVAFIKEHKETIYLVGAVAVLDQLLFNGAFRERIKGVVEAMLKKVEEKLKPEEKK